MLTTEEFNSKYGGKKATGRKRYKHGEMNKTEKKYADHLDLLKINGEVLWWKFECVTLKLGDDTRLTADFCVMLADGEIVLDDTKAFAKNQGKPLVTDDAAVKLRIASSEFPFRVRIVYHDGTGWQYKEIGTTTKVSP